MSDTYRPTTFDGIVGQPTDEIEALLDGPRTPDFLFHGPPGTGKTTTAYAIARRLQNGTADLMEFNASDERGIDTVRERIIPAADQTTLSGAPRVIFLDEMESMTTDAQQALRQPMEQSDAVFILACNDLSAVHDAIQSRCHVFEFDALSNRAIRQRVQQLADRDGENLDPDHIKTIVSFANGDMRSAVQRYQQVVQGGVESDPSPEPPTDGGSLEAAARQYTGQ